MSALRARCPDCRTLTAVAIGPEYQCHSCGREFAAGLDPRAARMGGRRRRHGGRRERWLRPWPEAAVIEEATLEAQIEGWRASFLPDRSCSVAAAVRTSAQSASSSAATHASRSSGSTHTAI